ncbi:MAG: Zn-dependent hydrolase, partial [Pedobacter sp.]
MKYITRVNLFITGCLLIFGITSCNNTQKNTDTNGKATTKDSLQSYVDQRIAIYETVKLTTNLNDLTTSERKILPLLIQAAQIMDKLFWKQAYPHRDSLLSTIKDEKTKSFVMINYGPWDRLN